ncbi:MAG TPA: MBL fold metallo-hydrolase [Candidatus Limnocylindrales bacterium]|nr:MBL fold metallo-hydrolase [Candidatus Limnocylindrales bacterium]
MIITSSLGGGKQGDPSLYVDLVDKKMGLLFDCGFNNFTVAQIKKIAFIFVSHTHVDHFIGFDIILRMSLDEPKSLVVYGPPGILQNVRGKLNGYTWNICHDLKLKITVVEIRNGKRISASYYSHRGFQEEDISEGEASSVLVETEDFKVEYTALDHMIPSFGYAFTEKDSYNVNKERLASLGFSPGPWLKELKERARNPLRLDEMIRVQGKWYPVQILKEQLLEFKKGRKIAYVTDTIFDEITRKKITQLVREADLFYCESCFLEKDRDKAKISHHLTAREAGILAREAQVKKLILFHISRRYQEIESSLEEARKEFAATE